MCCIINSIHFDPIPFVLKNLDLFFRFPFYEKKRHAQASDSVALSVYNQIRQKSA